MDRLAAVVGKLENSTAKLVQEHLELKQEKAELLKTLEAMKKEIAEKEENITGLIEKNKILSIGQSTSLDHRSDIKKTINEMIREVDRCIAQLNK